MNTIHILPDEKERQVILNELDKNIIVEAAAGTGKTTSLVGRMKNLLITGKCDIQNLVAITFTKKASVELKTRFRMALEKKVMESNNRELRRALDAIEKCFIGTIHSFCARLLRERPVEADVDIPFEELDPEDDLLLRQEVWEEFITGLAADDSDALARELYSLGIHVPDLYQAFLVFTDYPDVDEWPGEERETSPPDMESFLRKIREYAEHMKKLGPRLPHRWNNDRLIPFYREFPKAFAVYDTKAPYDVYELLLLWDRNLIQVQKEWTAENQFTKEECKLEKERWDRFRQETIRPALELWRIARYGPVIRILKKARTLYDEQRRVRGTLNFQDLLLKTAYLLREHPNVRLYFKKKYTHLLIDEFQDTDPVQAQIMMLLTSQNHTEADWKKCIPVPGSLFVVGDPKQSIYRFRRADIITYNEVKQIICGNENDRGILAKLYANFRSTAPVRNWINTTFEHNFPSNETLYSPVYVPLERGKEISPGDALGRIYRITVPEEYCKKSSQAVQYEAERISSCIRYMLDHKNESSSGPLVPSDFMIMTRTKKNLSLYANALEEVGIPYAITGGTTLNDIRELRLLYLCLKTVLNPNDQVALAGTLRGELFGFSDALLYEYSIKGGIFSYTKRVPDTLADTTKQLFTEAFEKLDTFRQYFHQMPAVSALERMIGDLGLMPLACLGNGGHLKAGGLAKCMELIRALKTELWSPLDIANYMKTLVEKEITCDGISISGSERNVVRIMNLHQAKGLEARVVFLADPTGKKKHTPDIHIMREGKQTKGYITILKRSNFTNEYIAYPENRNVYEKNEQEFLRNEDTRLNYVAATRAKQILVVVQREKNETRNFWTDLKEFLVSVPELPDYGKRPVPGHPYAITVRPEEIHEAGEMIESNIVLSVNKTYQVKKAKEYALHEYPPHLLELPGEPPGFSPESSPTAVSAFPGKTGIPEESGEHGTEWGEIIHRLLEVRMKDHQADLHSLADSLIDEYELDPGLTAKALMLVESVTRSGIWKRARMSSRVFTEIPFQVLLDKKYKPGLPTILRGVIDLIFSEDPGWVLVDYKTDRIENDRDIDRLVALYNPQLLLYADAWNRITGETVKEAGLYFTRINEYRICHLQR
ncbi:MAG: UvrD-helicase domain-containing protein [Spirochaetales bacterium]|nr:UvrD-helicase domain-containing protein [Spirochaetales bacterium]